jgi:hypothetical protein
MIPSDIWLFYQKVGLDIGERRRRPPKSGNVTTRPTRGPPRRSAGPAALGAGIVAQLQHLLLTALIQKTDNSAGVSRGCYDFFKPGRSDDSMALQHTGVRRFFVSSLKKGQQ